MKNNLKTDVKVMGNDIIISIYEKKGKQLAGTISAKLNHCAICGRLSVDTEEKNICDSCKLILDNYNANKTKKKSRTIKEQPITATSVVNIKDVLPLDETDEVIHKTKTVVNYNKSQSDTTISNLRIENLKELYEGVDKSKISIGKFDAFLKYAIKGETYQSIAHKLNIKEVSVKQSYYLLSKYNLVVNDMYKPAVTVKVLYSELSNAEHLLMGSDKAAYLKLKDYMTDWTTADSLAKATGLGRLSILKYVQLLNQHGLIEKTGSSQKGKMYRLKGN